MDASDEVASALGELAGHHDIAFFPGPGDLGLAELGDEGMAARISAYPRDDVVLLMAALSQMFHAFGELNPSMQRAGVDIHLRGAARERALAFLDRFPNAVVLTYEAAVRIAAMAMAHGDHQSRPITDDDVSALLSLLPEVQSRLSRLETLGDPSLVRGTVPYYEDAALTMFLSVNAPGQASPHRTMLDAVTLGTLAAGRVRGGLKPKRRRRLDEALAEAAGGTLEEVHAAVVQVANHFIVGEAKLVDGKPPQHFVRLDELRAPGHRLGHIAARAVEAACVQGPIADLGLADAVGPKACLPPSIRWRPFYKVGRDPQALACWDVRLLHAMLGGMFPEWIAHLLGDQGSIDAVGTAWDHGVEYALDTMVSPFIPTWGRPPVTGTNCDRMFTHGNDLFLVEIKNVRPSPSLLAAPSVGGLRAWLKGKFFDDGAGLPQIYETLRKLDAERHRVAGRKVRRFRRAWPVIVSWTRTPGHTVFTDLLARIDAEVGRPDLGRMATRTMPPVLLNYDGLMHVVSLLPAMETAGVTLGDALVSFHNVRADRPLTLGTFITNAIGTPPMPPQVTATMSAALEPVRELGERLKKEQAPRR